MSPRPADFETIVAKIRDEVRAAGIPAAPNEALSVMQENIGGIAERVADQFYLCISEYPDAETDALDRAFISALDLVDAGVRGCLEAYGAAEPKALDNLAALAERAFVARLHSLSASAQIGGTA